MNESKLFFNKSVLRQQYEKFSGLGNTYYSLKTNSNKSVIAELKQLNSNFLISNISHLKKLQDIGIKPKRICMINVLADIQTLKNLYKNGVRFFTFDNFNTLKKFSMFANLSECKISIRLSQMEISKYNLSHLGASKKDCFEMINFLKGKCSNVGVSFYIQKNIKREKDIIFKFLNYIKTHFANINFINIGGISNDFNILYDNLKQFKFEEVNLEIGRLLVEEAISLKTNIIRVKKVNDEFLLITKNGVFNGFFDKIYYNKKYDIYIATSNNKLIKLTYKSGPNKIAIHIFGGSSDSGDYLGKLYLKKEDLSNLYVGNNLIVKNVGAYFEEFFMNYCDDNKTKYIEVDDEI